MNSSQAPYKIPSTNALLSRLIVEVLLMTGFGYPMLHIYVLLQGKEEPYHRGFFCDDESIKYPLIDETISVEHCVLIWIAIVLFIVCVVEGLLFMVYRFETLESLIHQTGQDKCNIVSKIPFIVIELYRMFGYFFMGSLATLLTTEMAKYKIGRLRPHFLSVCKVELNKELCLDDFGYNKFVTNYTCTGDVDAVREARKSFFSGHSSFSFYCSTFLIIYLQARLSRGQWRHGTKRTDKRNCSYILRLLKVSRPFLQFGAFILALFIAFTRISDYKHHPFDIIAGIIVGVVFALIVLLFLVDLFERPRSFEVKLNRVDLIGQKIDALLPKDICNGDQETSCITQTTEPPRTRSGLAPMARQEVDTETRVVTHSSKSKKSHKP